MPKIRNLDLAPDSPEIPLRRGHTSCFWEWRLRTDQHKSFQHILSLLTFTPLWRMFCFRLEPMLALAIHLTRSSVLAGTFVSLSNWCGISHSTLFVPSVLADTRSSLQSMWNLTIHPSSGHSILVGSFVSLSNWCGISRNGKSIHSINNWAGSRVS